jgi:hypothetical protein
MVASSHHPHSLLASKLEGTQTGNLASQPLWDSQANAVAIGRRTFLERSVGILAGAAAVHSAPTLAQTGPGIATNFFPGFRRQKIETSGTTINVLVGGSAAERLHAMPHGNFDS